MTLGVDTAATPHGAFPTLVIGRKELTARHLILPRRCLERSARMFVTAEIQKKAFKRMGCVLVALGLWW